MQTLVWKDRFALVYSWIKNVVMQSEENMYIYGGPSAQGKLWEAQLVMVKSPRCTSDKGEASAKRGNHWQAQMVKQVHKANFSIF